ncbi:MAG TPA: ATP-binding protein [Solirubrobacterales bacterium]|nr:ATP-binding protein [Solirubrobacterales bacterium]
MAAIGQPGTAAKSRRPFGVRLYLTLGFAAVALIAAGFSYLLVTGSSDQAAGEEASNLTIGRTARVADRIGVHRMANATAQIESVNDQGFSAWAFDRRGRLLTPRLSHGVRLGEVPGGREAIAAALRGSRVVEQLPMAVTVASAPILRNGRLSGALLARAERPEEINRTIDAIRGDRLTAAAIAIAVAVVIGFLIATAITTRVKRLAGSAARISEGRLDEPLEGTGGRDEIADLGMALETMRIALRETFVALSSERDRLSAIFDALDDAVMVVGPQAEVRFSNRAAAPLIGPDGKAIVALVPWLRRAAERGAVQHDGLRVGDRVYAVGIRHLPAEDARLAVVRDRTAGLRRELAEREFVSNAAHELRNPIAGISGSIEVLRAGAKDDPNARDHFLARLSEDVERVTRLTDSLLTLARMEAVEKETTEALDVGITIEEAAQAVAPPDGLEVRLDVGRDVAARADPVLLRQVLIGLLSNAFKNTPPPGVVTVRARRDGDRQVLMEVSDTGAGIASDEVGRVFERFYRGAGSLEQEGFGLGLSIAKRMVDVMEGEMGVESKLGTGSTFWVRLPVAEVAATPVA